MANAGVIGLGMIGGGVAQCLARAGLLGAVFDVRPDAATGLDGVPPLSDSPREVARQCDVILIAVVTADQTIDVLTGPRGILAAARPDLNVVLLSTVSIEDLARIREFTDKAMVGLIDCGVSGGQRARQNGLVCLVGADEIRLAKVKPVLDGFASTVAHMGGPGSGMAAKIARNVIVYGCLRAGYEGTALARAAGVDLKKFAQAIEDSAEGVGGPMMLMGRPVDPLTDPVEANIREGVRNLLHKDLEAAIELGRSVNVELPLTELTLRTDRATTGLA